MRFPREQHTTKQQKSNQNPNTNQNTTNKNRQGNKQNKVKRGETTRPFQPLKSSLPPCSNLHVVQYLDVSHIYICTLFLRRVPYVRLQTTSLDLVSALSSLPPFRAVLHECIHFQLRLSFLT